MEYRLSAAVTVLAFVLSLLISEMLYPVIFHFRYLTETDRSDPENIPETKLFPGGIAVAFSFAFSTAVGTAFLRFSENSFEHSTDHTVLMLGVILTAAAFSGLYGDFLEMSGKTDGFGRKVGIFTFAVMDICYLLFHFMTGENREIVIPFYKTLKTGNVYYPIVFAVMLFVSLVTYGGDRRDEKTSDARFLSLSAVYFIFASFILNGSGNAEGGIIASACAGSLVGFIGRNIGGISAGRGCYMFAGTAMALVCVMTGNIPVCLLMLIPLMLRRKRELMIMLALQIIFGCLGVIVYTIGERMI